MHLMPFFLGVIYLIAGWLAFIPLAFLCLSVMIGWYFKQQIALLAQQINSASHFKKWAFGRNC